MALYKKLDLWSITDELDKMIDFYFNGNSKNSPYWDYYSEQINDLSNLAGDLYCELDTIKSHLWYQMPSRKIEFSDEDECSQTSISWFNTAAAMLADTDMVTLLENENIYRADPEIEKQKRITALNRLTKFQQMYLYAEVIGFITRFLELQAAFETIQAVIAELDFHQSAVNGKTELTLPQSAYV